MDITLFGYTLPVLQLFIGLWITVYGLAFGVSNSIGHIIYFCKRESAPQSDLGKFLDAVWVVAIVVLIGINW